MEKSKALNTFWRHCIWPFFIDCIFVNKLNTECSCTILCCVSRLSRVCSQYAQTGTSIWNQMENAMPQGTLVPCLEIPWSSSRHCAHLFLFPLAAPGKYLKVIHTLLTARPHSHTPVRNKMVDHSSRVNECTAVLESTTFTSLTT